MKRLISAFAAVFVMTLCLTPAWGAEPEQHVFDNADIFTDAEEAELEKRIEQFQADVQADAFSPNRTAASMIRSSGPRISMMPTALALAATAAV